MGQEGKKNKIHLCQLLIEAGEIPAPIKEVALVTRFGKPAATLLLLLSFLFTPDLVGARPCDECGGSPPPTSTQPKDQPASQPPAQEGIPADQAQPEQETISPPAELVPEKIPTDELDWARNGVGILITEGPIWVGGGMPFQTARSYQDRLGEWFDWHSWMKSQYPQWQHSRYMKAEADKGSIEGWLAELDRRKIAQQEAEAARRAQQEGQPEDGGQKEQPGEGEKKEETDCSAAAQTRADLMAQKADKERAITGKEAEIKAAHDEVSFAQNEMTKQQDEVDRLKGEAGDLLTPREIQENLNAQKAALARKATAEQNKKKWEARLVVLGNELDLLKQDLARINAAIQEIDEKCPGA